VLTEVWGPPALRRRLRDAARAGLWSGGGVSILDGLSVGDCGGCGGGLDGIVLVGAAVALGVFTLWFLFFLGRAAVRAWSRRLPPPRGASRPPASPGPATGQVGVIAAARHPLATDPVTGRGALAFALELGHRSGWRRGRRVMLRDAATTGFELVLDGGQRVRVPAGPCVIDLSRAPGADRAWAAAHLARLDPAGAAADDLDPFLFHEVRHLALRPGDRVEIRNRLIPTIDPRAPADDYRAPAATVLVPEGVPRLARIGRSSDPGETAATGRSRRGTGPRSPG
jgi:hypothetical protein